LILPPDIATIIAQVNASLKESTIAHSMLFYNTEHFNLEQNYHTRPFLSIIFKQFSQVFLTLYIIVNIDHE